MFHVVICDDQPEDREKIRHILKDDLTLFGSSVVFTRKQCVNNVGGGKSYFSPDTII